ncbi:aspartate beta-hydroxylase domain-containing protein 2 [Electrophorus electricus]|uniref:Aspartate beta-hydroxylase domain-containing protein 2 n=1 Tax=Electrophorus electricus TaxID=8005 RepID=A0A4W4HPS5_ELEEL|nr:aspartate beta-hydroxylase domain-containing protein 2 [Electrophorus electricus]XP_026877806.2 aspartate beta-hydroxylase domain-containing protein 2 [Electrophorus electricus]XP_026877807.2 aspartate beta-hydroxylase domain-containing protein 2 [Electrophorus electricus]XP_026877808.2 aspartate beta-hydroxylase domain-containing protein 2 [Electrophorus electricus]
MEWSLERMREWVAGGMQSVRECEGGALGTVLCLALLFIWYCYRMGCEQTGSALRGGGYTPEARGSALPSGGLAPDLSSRLAAPKICQARGGASSGGGSSEEELNGFAYCQSPECFRCAQPAEGFNQRLYQSLQEYAKRYTWAGMGRVHKGVRAQGRSLPCSRPSIQKPEVFFLPDLPSAPFFSREAQKHDVELLERSFAALLTEFECVYRLPLARPNSPLPLGWKVNSTPRGHWWTFYLVNQGTPMALNARRCPRAWRVLGQLRTFIANNVFGNACFSVLSPGAIISEHYGPTNVRLRCHLGLKVPSSCELVVGGEPQCWSEGSCLLFDDSFLHTAFHEGSSEGGPRVVFMVDLWHPNVAAAERQALDYIFTPGR